MVASISGNATPNDLFFQPDKDNSYLQLLIKEIVADTSIVCYGDWGTTTPVVVTGKFFDYHIDTGSGAINYGDDAYLGWQTGAGDVCDLDGNGEVEEHLPYGEEKGSGTLKKKARKGVGSAP